MTRNTPFNNPMFLGFDHFERVLERLAKAPSEGYPPYNIEKTGDDSLRITLAVAGFNDNELSIVIEDNELIVKGVKEHDEECEKIYIYRGIAFRHFQRIFILADGMEVKKAELDKGLLNIDIIRPKPEIKSREIKIEKKSSKS